METKQVHPNSECANCKYVFGAHGSISQLCPYKDTYFAAKPSSSKGGLPAVDALHLEAKPNGLSAEHLIGYVLLFRIKTYLSVTGRDEAADFVTEFRYHTFAGTKCDHMQLIWMQDMENLLNERCLDAYIRALIAPAAAIA